MSSGLGCSLGAGRWLVPAAGVLAPLSRAGLSVCASVALSVCVSALGAAPLGAVRAGGSAAGAERLRGGRSRARGRAKPHRPHVLTRGSEMDRGVTVENPYASVNIPREQFQQSFITRYLRDEPTIITNPAAVPSYGTEEQPDLANGWSSPTIATDKSWSRPYNPYASLRMPNGDSSASFYTVTLDKPPKGQEQGAGRRCGCCRCCSCCPKCCCVIS